MTSKLSVIICTYNPAEHVFSKCLSAVSIAAGLQRPLEIIIVDNNSDNHFSQQQYFISFLKEQGAKLVCEKKQGLTNARLRGILEASGDILVFIDDDNIISSNFFIEVLNIATAYPHIGSFSGQVSLLYEQEPPRWTKRYWGMLVHRQFSGTQWSNVPFDQQCMPCGAGLCVRKEVADYYLMLHETGKRNFNLDRSVNSLLSGGDNDLAMCACDIGMSMGVFSSLTMQHYAARERFTLRYLKKLAYGIYYSEKLLKYMRLNIIENTSVINRAKSFLRTLLMNPYDGAINRACLKGSSDAIAFLETNQ